MRSQMSYRSKRELLAQIAPRYQLAVGVRLTVVGLFWALNQRMCRSRISRSQSGTCYIVTSDANSPKVLDHH